MKLKLAALSLMFSAFPSFAEEDPVLMYIGGEPIYKSEFEYIYNKNNSSTMVDKKSLDEYIELFANYKMKVFEAKEEGYNTKYDYTKEFRKYEDQLAAPYMLDQELEDNLIKEAYERMKVNLTVSHILIKTDDKDTMAAYNKINDIYKQLQEGKEFGQLAKEYSECPSASKLGFIGKVSVFSTVYPFENAAYNTPEKTYSKPFRSQFGYHIVYVHDRYDALEEKHISQIFKRRTNDDVAKQSIDSIYFLLQSGAKFEDLAEKYSDDRESAHKGGDLGVLGERVIVEQIFVAAQGLQKEGDYTMVSSQFGYHIVKLAKVVKLGSYKENYESIKKKVERDGRSVLITDKFLTGLNNKYNFTLVDGGLDPFYEVTADTNATYIIARNKTKKLEEPLFIMDGKYYPQSSFSEYYANMLTTYLSLKNPKPDKNAARFVNKSSEEVTDMIFNDFINNKLIELEKEYIKEKNPEYRNLLREYSDGMLLFEISNAKVWNKASVDKKGLEQYFKDNKSSYKWDSPRFKGEIVYCVDLASYNDVKNLYKTVSVVDSFNTKVAKAYSTSNVKIEKGIFSKGANKVADRDIFKTGIEYNDVKYPYAFAIGKLTSSPETYEDVKGPVTADYQNYLEEEWVKALKKKYNVRINKDVLSTIKSNK